MISLRNLSLSFTLLVMTVSFASPQVTTLCKGFLPPNNLKMPLHIQQAGGISEVDYNSILDRLQKFYTPVIAARGGTFTVNRLWDDPTVNASANRQGTLWHLNMYGGLARLPQMTKDVYFLVACHETGHHLGGAPKFFGASWGSNEGEADYFATLDCLRNMFTDADNLAFVSTQTLDPVLSQECSRLYSTQAEKNLCLRIGDAGGRAARLYQTIKNIPVAPSFATPDPTVVAQTEDDHPEPQCRLDTYFQGALCRHDLQILPSDSDPDIGACADSVGTQNGARPHCWYNPNSSEF